MMRRHAGFSAFEWALVGLLICILMTWITSVGRLGRRRAKDVSCTTNVRQLAMAMALYAADYQGRGPSDPTQLGALMSYVRNYQIFVCPAARRHRSKGQRCDYVFYLRMTLDDRPDRILVMDDSAMRHTYETWIGARLDGAAVQLPARQWRGYPAWGYEKPADLRWPEREEWQPPMRRVPRPPFGPPGPPTQPPFTGKQPEPKRQPPGAEQPGTATRPAPGSQPPAPQNPPAKQRGDQK